MSRLIDADKLIEDVLNSMPTGSARGVFRAFIDEQQTAFDVDKVVSELDAQSKINLKKGLIEVLPDEARPYLKAVESFDKAIEIVKRGVIDENTK